MSDVQQDPELSAIPEAVAEPKKRWSLQIVWLIPIVAAIIGGTLAVRTYLNKGPTVTITFKTGDGLEAGKTKIKFKDVTVGVVKEVTFSKGLDRVLVTAEMVKGATPYMVEDTRFWVVRPRISGGAVTGLGTLLGGSYIGLDIGKSKKTQLTFEGLETPPAVTMDVPGSRFRLHGESLGSLDIGSPVYFRQILVGQIVSYELDKSGKGVTFQVFIAAPYDRYVKSSTHFWNASGIDVSMDAGGLKVNTESLASLLIGGIAFQTPDTEAEAVPSDGSTVFTLFSDRDQAMTYKENLSVDYVLVFRESVRGLTIGAPVDFRGLVVGEVTDIRVQNSSSTKQVDMLVYIRYYPNRLRSRAVGKLPDLKGYQSTITTMVENGLRAQLKTGSLVTGQLLVALDFFPDAPKNSVNWKSNPPQLPTITGNMTEFQETLSHIAKKIDRLPVDEIVAEVRKTLQDLDATVKNTDRLIQRVDSQMVPELQATMADARKTLGAARQTLAADAPLQTDLREALRELARSAQSLRTLTDYLERHPETLIRGKQEDTR